MIRIKQRKVGVFGVYHLIQSSVLHIMLQIYIYIYVCVCVCVLPIYFSGGFHEDWNQGTMYSFASALIQEVCYQDEVSIKTHIQ